MDVGALGALGQERFVQILGRRKKGEAVDTSFLQKLDPKGHRYARCPRAKELESE